MKLVHALKPIEKSIFLAGPTPRDPSVPSWRPSAIRLLDELNFSGTVYLPETEDDKWQHEYYDQIYWEWEAINISTVVAFWVPRDLVDMPAFTTNVEYGLVANSSKVVLGYPEDAPKMKYLDALAGRYNIPVTHSLPNLMQMAVSKSENPFA